MSLVTIPDLIQAGVHFGHQKSRWNPRMAKYIHSKKNNMHLIDLRKTVRGLVRATNLLEKLSHTGGEVLVVGTKHQIKSLVKSEASRIGAHYVNERWLGGTLTNFTTIRARLKRLVEIEEYERTGEIYSFSKKMVSQISREKRKLLRNLEGVRNMSRRPDILIIIDPRREHIAVAEAQKLKIPTICIVDTDSDPTNIDIVVPGNDDSFRSVQLLLTTLIDAAQRGQIKRDASMGLTQQVAVSQASVQEAVDSAAEAPAEEAPAAEETPAEAPAEEAPAAEAEAEEAKTVDT